MISPTPKKRRNHEIIEQITFAILTSLFPLLRFCVVSEEFGSLVEQLFFFFLAGADVDLIWQRNDWVVMRIVVFIVGRVVVVLTRVGGARALLQIFAKEIILDGQSKEAAS